MTHVCVCQTGFRTAGRPHPYRQYVGGIQDLFGHVAAEEANYLLSAPLPVSDEAIGQILAYAG
jgi:hypothetical protein